MASHNMFPTRHIPMQSDPSTATSAGEVTLLCEGQEFKLPARCLIQSSVLSTAFNRRFKETLTGKIEVTAFSAVTVGRLVEYLISGNYDVNVGEPEDWPRFEYYKYRRHNCCESTDVSELRSACNPSVILGPRQTCTNDMVLRQICISQIADYYCVNGLKDFVRGRIIRLLENRWSSCGYLTIMDIILSGSVADTELCHVITNTMINHMGNPRYTLMDRRTSHQHIDAPNGMVRPLTDPTLIFRGSNMSEFLGIMRGKNEDMQRATEKIAQIQSELDQSRSKEHEATEELKTTNENLRVTQEALRKTLQMLEAERAKTAG